MSKKKCDCVSMEWCDECCPVKPAPPSDDAGRVGKVVLRQVFEDDEWSDCHPSQFNHMKKCGYKVRELVLASDLDAVRAELEKEKAHSKHLVAAMSRKIDELIAAESQCAYYRLQYTRAEEVRKEACKANLDAQVKMSWQADELAASQQECERLREALAGLSAACPSELDCYAFHHAKPDQHEYGDTCQPKQRYEQALAKAAAALATGGRHGG